MAKDEINRATRAEAGDVVGAPKQQDVAELLKKMKVVAEADAKAHTQASDEQAASTEQTGAQNQAQSADAQADASQMVASADSIFASDVAPVEVAMLDGGSVGGGGGVSTGTLLAIGGVALVGGGIAIAANNDSGGGGGNKSAPTAVTAGAASVNEGSSVNFNVTGTPGATLSWAVDAAHTGDVSASAGSVTLDSNGNGVITITTVADNTTEGAETLTLTVDGATASVTINDTSTLPPAEDVNLTTLTDTVDLSGKSGASVVTGVAAGGNAFNETFSVGDKVTGNGSTILDLKVADGGTEAVVQLDNFAAINLVNLAGVTNANFDATLWTDISSVNLVDGQDGLRANVIDLERDVDLSVASGVSGSIAVSYEDHLQVTAAAGHDSEISYVDNNVDASVANSESAAFQMSYSDPAAMDVVLGNVSAMVGDSAQFLVAVSSSGGDGDIGLGDVDVSAGENALISVFAGATGGATGAYNLDVGNVGIEGDVGTVAEVRLALSNPEAGDVVVGNVAVTNVSIAEISIGRSGGVASGDVTVGDVTVSVTNTTTTALDLNIGNYGSVSVGNLTVGDVNLTLGQDASGTGSITASASVAAGSDDAAVGQVTVGNIDVKLDTSASLSTLSIGAFADNNGTGNALVSGLTIGDISVNAEVGAYARLDISASASVSGVSATGSVGDVSIGDIDLVMNDGASVSISVSISASNGGSVGDVTVGDIASDSANGVNADASISIDISAVDGSIGLITLGNVNAIVGESASFDLDLSATAGAIAGFTLGDVDVEILSSTGGSTASADVSVDLSATSGDLGDVAFGNISAVVGDFGSFEMSVSLSAAGSIGDISFGDIDLQAVGEDAFAYLYLSSANAGEDIASLTIGNIDLLASGTNASATVQFTMNAVANIGDITVGAIDLGVVGDSAFGSAGFYISAGSDIGDVTFGDIDVSVVGGTNTGAAASVTISASANEIGDVTLGDITLSAAVASADADFNAFLDFDLTISTAFGGDLTVGDVTLNLEAANGTGTGSATINLSVDVDGDITVGDIAINLNADDGVLPATAGTNNIGGLGIQAGGNISVGTIAVSGGDGSMDNLDTFANILGFFNAGGGIAIAGVDYSGYLADADINVSAVPGITGFATIVGSDFNDTITDNAGKNVITGNDGVDVFNFLNTNTGLTAATADQITDWVKADDEIRVGFNPVDGTNYSEGTYADFASFLAGANAAVGNDAVGKVHVGLVAGSLWVAVENLGPDGHPGVDYVVQLNGINDLNGIDVNDFS